MGEGAIHGRAIYSKVGRRVGARDAVGALPVELFADYGRNSAADDGLDTAYNFGVLVGKANAPGRWEFGVFRQKVEKDALFAQLIDSDFGGGTTDSEGWIVRGAFAPTRNWTLNATYFINQRNVDVGTEADYDRLQLDFNVKF